MVRASASGFALVLARWAGLVGLLLASIAVTARADTAKPRAHGVAVVALGEVDGAAAYALAQGVYRVAALRPSVDDVRARALLGIAPGPAAETAESKRLAELRDGVRDEGAVSRSVLGAIASSTQAEAVALVRPSETPGHVQVRLFLVATSAFDVSLYDGDANDAGWRTEVVHALERRFDPTASPAAAAPVVAKKRTENAAGSKPFYKSPWFWGAIGGAVALGGTALLVSHVTSSEDVRIRVEPPTSSASSALGFLRFGSVAP